MRALPERLASMPTTRRVLTTISPEFSCSPGSLVPAAANNAWFSTNDPIAYPFRLSHPVVVKQLGWLNGTSVGGNCDAGIYTASWARVVSCGSTAAAGSSNVFQWVDVTDTALSAGTLYYLAAARDNTTANRTGRWGSFGTASIGTLVGTQSSTTDAFPLPDPLTNMSLASIAAIYLLGIKCQETIF